MRCLQKVLQAAFLGYVIPAAAFAAEPLTYSTVETLDLTEPFHTKTKWQFKVTQEPSENDFIDGNLHFCFIHEGASVCPEILIHFDCSDYVDGKPVCPPTKNDSGYTLPYNIFDGAIVFNFRQRRSDPLLVVMARGNWGGPGMPTGPMVWAYDVEADVFHQIFQGLRSPNIETEVRFITSGPLEGDIVANDQTDHPPYPYIITLYKLSESTRYDKSLSYKSRTKYRDGNPLKVIDEEMPELLQRLHLWKPGDPLPTPPAMPDRCTALLLEDGVEHCH